MDRGSWVLLTVVGGVKSTPLTPSLSARLNGFPRTNPVSSRM